MGKWLTLGGCVTWVGNALFLMFWFWVDRARPLGPNAEPLASYDAISLQITILGIILAAVAVGLGVAAVFGYTALRDHMLMNTEKLINERLENHPMLKGGLRGLTQRGPGVPGSDAGVAPVTEG